MDRIGVELVLKQNLEQQLKTIMPMLTNMNKMFENINKTMLQMESIQKRTTNQFDKMASSISNVGRKERELQTVNQRVMGVGQSATKATGLMGGLARGIGTVVAAAGPLLGLYKVMQGMQSLGGAALDFQKQAVSLQQSNLTPEFQKKLSATVIDLGSSGKYAMSASDFIEAFKETRSVSRSSEDALANLPLIGTADLKMRQVNDKLTDQAKMLPRFFEKFGAFDDPKKKLVTDALLKVIQFTGGTIQPGQILQQISTSGTSVIGSDPYKEIMEQALSIKDSAAGAGKGSSGRGRGGVGRQAVDRLMNLGIMTPAQATMLNKVGMFDITTLPKQAHTGHSIVYEDEHGKHIIYTGRHARGSTGTGSLKTSDIHASLITNRPEWMRLHANDPYQTGLDFAAGADILGGNKISGKFMQTRAAHISHFATLPEAQQKFLEAQLMAGMKMTGIDFLMERSIGKYKTSHDIFAKGVGGQPGLGATGDIAIKDRWEILQKRFETLGDALGTNKSIIEASNRFLDSLNNALTITNKYLQPIGDLLAFFIKALTPQIPFSDVIPKIQKAWDEESKKNPGNRKWISKGGLPNPAANISSGFVPPPPGIYDKNGKLMPFPSLLPEANGTSVPASVITASKASSEYHPFGRQMIKAGEEKTWKDLTNIYHVAKQAITNIKVDVDVKGVPPHLVKTTVAAVNNNQMKTNRRMGHSGGPAGGSYAHKDDYSGVSH